MKNEKKSYGPLLTTEELAEVLKVSKQTVFRMVKEEKLKPVELCKKKWLFKKKDIEEMLGIELD